MAAADADTIGEALDTLKETLGVDNLADPAASMLMSQAKAHAQGRPKVPDAGLQALETAQKERQATLVAQAAESRVSCGKNWLLLAKRCVVGNC
jgi:hypothetical protein